MRRIPISRFLAAAALQLVFLTTGTLHAGAVTLRVSQPGKPISPDLFGVFFEDLNWAADGGLYAELVQNRSFEYQATEQATWNALTSWELITRGEGGGTIAIDAADPIHPNNPHYAVLHVRAPGDGVGLANAGFDSIPIRAGERYSLSLFARLLYLKDRWGPAPTGSEAELAARPRDGQPGPLVVRLQSREGESLGEVTLALPGREWTRLAATITATATEEAARLVVLATIRAGFAFDTMPSSRAALASG